MQPNILFILIDDLGWRDLGCYGSTFYETPRLDRLAREGMMFHNAYAASPVCSPTRASILSGKYPARVGVTQWIGGHLDGSLKDVPYVHELPLEEQSLATSLREGGYQTWHVGKWHLGQEAFYPQHHGFDVNIGGSHRGSPWHGYVSPYQLPGLAEGPDGEYLTDRLTDDAIGLIRTRDRERPFYLNLCHYAVHTPIEAPGELIAKYRAKAKRLRLDEKDPFVEGETFPFVGNAGRRVTRRVLQSDPVYAAMLENLDANLGRVLDVLAEEGIAGNTVVVFTSDNGGLATAEGSPTCNHPLSEGKGWSYEGGTRVCQILRWPGHIPPGSHCDENVTSPDFYPTLLEAAGLPARPRQHCDGMSLGPLWSGDGGLDREAIYFHYPHYSNQGGTPSAAVVQGAWKLIRFFEGNRQELYHLADDISETVDLAPTHAGRVEAMGRLLDAWIAEVSAAIPEPNPNTTPDG
jgi:arylsulfatase A-like enzyme